MSDLDDEELKATRRLNGVDKKDSIEKDIKRCEKLTEPQNANWIGISNQLAIAHLIERIKELEAKLEEANKQLDLDYVDENYIPVKKVKDELKRAEKENEPCEKYEKESRMYWINQGVISLCRRLLKEGD